MNARKARAKTGFEAPELAEVVRTGGILHAVIRARGNRFVVDLVLRAGGTTPLVSRTKDTETGERQPRVFINIDGAAKVVRQAGITRGELVLDEWDPDKRLSAWARSDVAEGLKTVHEAARLAKEHGLLPPEGDAAQTEEKPAAAAPKAPGRRRKTE